MERKVEELSIEEKIGQMLIIGMDTTTIMDKIDDVILRYKIGGILLYKKNYQNYEELVELINYIRKINTANKIPLWIAIDQEGGRVNRMPPDFSNLPSAYQLASYEKEDLVKQAGEITGEMLSKTGFNLDFAPVLDIKRFEDKQAIGDRAFSEEKEKVTKCGITYMKELQKKNIMPVIKHFPGHGATKKDSHFVLPKIKESMKVLEKEDMQPFVSAIQEGADAILVSHLRIKRVTGRYPATMARKFVTRFIRKKYRFRGLVITDDMRMKGVELLYGKNKPVMKAFEAGYDVILLKYNGTMQVIQKIVEEVKKSPIKQARVNRSVARILKAKEKYKVGQEEILLNSDLVATTNQKIGKIKDTLQGGKSV